MAVLIKDVAERAGVSISTVSRILNHKEEDRIPKDTRDRVRQIATDLGYRPNAFARSLRENRTQTIGLLISGLQNPFFVSVLEAAERHAIAAGYQVLLAGSPSVRGSYYAHASIRTWPVDGLVIWSQPGDDLNEVIGSQASGTPTVYLSGSDDTQSDLVCFDAYRGMADLVEYLVVRGHRRLCYVSAYHFETRPEDDHRVNGFMKTCLSLGLTPEFHVMQLQEETKYAGVLAGVAIGAMDRDKRPDVLVCHNDVIAVGVFNGLLRAGLRVPEDIAVTGFDGIDDGRCLSRPLTTVVTSPDLICKAALTTLVRRVSGDCQGKPDRIVVPATLHIGETA